ncbi:LysR family transcriptional regulator [Niastella koreensis]|uniref:Transcriptional regulator, LysR family n=2 Tax=Niastella koreensis TaxID=354356 RepID=G8TH24_NIAKG|nr:LysR substrate-binding domain-containing protein [Niastella koreensis]AEW00635.1 transcriptional regulator, LysR family [Niastella koreensis GR20-10]OQP42267.1 LysR family transcriptional regulator [Niastella koreensis]
MLSYSHEVFFEVATNLSFSKAADILYISQPAITKHIQSLEKHYKISLFERKGNSVSLTSEGKILLEYVVKGRELQRQLEFDISKQKDLQLAKGSFTLGTSTTISLYVIPPVFSAFHQQYPNIDLKLVNRNSENILKALLDHEIDLAITEGRNTITSVKYQFFLTDEVIPVCSAKSSLVKKKNIAPDELKTIPVALRERGSGTLSAVTEALQKCKLSIADLQHKIVLGGTEALKNFLLDDTCLGFLPLRSVARQLKNGELVRLTIPGLTIHRSFYFMQRRGSEADRINQLFIKLATSHYNKKL